MITQRVQALMDAYMDVNAGMMFDKFSEVSTVFGVGYNKDSGLYEFAQFPKPIGSRCDPHRHTKYSDNLLGTWTTNKLGVKESYAPVHRVLRKQVQSGMDILTTQDHNNVNAYPEMLKFERENEEFQNKTFLNCEYDVRVPGNKTIHVGVWGIDYPFQESTRLSEKEVRTVHHELNRERNRGVDQFKKTCDKLGYSAIGNHLPWICTPFRPLNGEDLWHIADVFDFYEINGDCQKENIFSLELALERGKTLVAGTDLHNLRYSNIFTETIKPVDTAWEYLVAVQKGEVTIGNTHRLPRSANSAFDIFRTNFNGTRLNRYNDTYRGIGSYATRDWKNKKKWVALSVLLGSTVGAAYGWWPLALIPTLAALYLGGTIPIKYGFVDKSQVAHRTVRLYNDYQNVRLRKKLATLDVESLDEKSFDKERESLEEITETKKKQFESTHFRTARRPWEIIANYLPPKNVEMTYDFGLGDEVELEEVVEKKYSINIDNEPNKPGVIE
jgi:hypothetical protein